MNKKLLLAAGVAVVIVLGIALAMNGHENKKAANPVSAPVAPPTTAVIEITPTGFVPKTLAVKPNTNVTWVNLDTMPHLPAADPYPGHDSLPNLVAPRALGNKESYTFLVTKQETIQYHDDLKPTITGTIEVR